MADTVPRLLRDAGLELTTLAERYGVPTDEQVTDARWLTDAGRRGKVVLMKDARVRCNEAERAAIVRHKVRCFCIANANLSSLLHEPPTDLRSPW